jgi:hypothetical protein
MEFDEFAFGGDEKFIAMIVMRFIVLVFHVDRLGESQERTECLRVRWVVVAQFHVRLGLESLVQTEYGRDDR